MKKTTMFFRILMTAILFVAFLGVVVLSQSVLAAPPKGSTYVFQTISISSSSVTTAYGINNDGYVAGTFQVPGATSGTYNGFIRMPDGTYNGIFIPSHQYSTYAGVRDINSNNEVIGWWNTSEGTFVGTIDTSGYVHDPKDINTMNHAILGMNDNLQVVGWYQSGSVYYGFVGTLDLDTGEIISLTDVKYDDQSNISTYAHGINNDGDIVGRYTDVDGKDHGFLLSGGTYTSIDYPGSKSQATYATAINNNGDMVGSFADTKGNYHGFLRSASGAYTTIDYKSAVSTFPQGINDNGEIAGYYDTRKAEYGFVATPK